MNSHRSLSPSRRMVLGGIASLLGGACATDAFAAAAKSCRLTERDIIGPYYRSARRSRLNWLGQINPANGLSYLARYNSSDCRSRLPNTLIEIWQANSAGLYDTAHIHF